MLVVDLRLSFGPIRIRIRDPLGFRELGVLGRYQRFKLFAFVVDPLSLLGDPLGFDPVGFAFGVPLGLDAGFFGFADRLLFGGDPRSFGLFGLPLNPGGFVVYFGLRGPKRRFDFEDFIGENLSLFVDFSAQLQHVRFEIDPHFLNAGTHLDSHLQSAPNLLVSLFRRRAIGVRYQRGKGLFDLRNRGVARRVFRQHFRSGSRLFYGHVPDS
ncbi:MAG: hypothetical protein ACRDD1_07470 [Planctomycetia bacterium]